MLSVASMVSGTDHDGGDIQEYIKYKKLDKHVIVSCRMTTNITLLCAVSFLMLVEITSNDQVTNNQQRLNQEIMNSVTKYTQFQASNKKQKLEKTKNIQKENTKKKKKNT